MSKWNVVVIVHSSLFQEKKKVVVRQKASSEIGMREREREGGGGGVAGVTRDELENEPSSRMPGNHIHGNGLPATFVPGRRNVCEGYWAVDESYKKSLASPFHYFLNVKSTSQILRVYLTGKEKPVWEAQH